MVAGHGALFALAALTFGHTDNEAFGIARFWLLIAPALILAMPFTPLLWTLRLMEAPGWFAWPKPLGFVLVYFVWIAAFVAASLLFRRKT